MQGKTLKRSATNQVLAGVCGGIGEYFDVDPTLVRVIFIILGLATGSGVIIYIILWLVIPSPTSAAQTPGETTMREGFKEMETKFNEVKDKVEYEVNSSSSPIVETKSSGPNWLGVSLVIIGGYFFLKNFGFFRTVDFGKLWPIAIILIGVYFLVNRKR